MKKSRKAQYTHRILFRGGVASEHTSKTLAEKVVSRLVKMSNGKLTREAFAIEPITATKAHTKNPRRASKKTAPQWAIYAKREGKKAPRLFFSGDRFTNNGKPTTFASGDTAFKKARELLDAHPVLAAYRVTVEKVKRKRNP